MDRRQALKTLALGVTALSLPSRASLAAVETPAAAKPVAPETIGAFTLPPLGYAVDALEPFLDAQTMTIHHDKHHASYVTNLNKAVAGRKEVAGQTLEQLLHDLSKVPDDIRMAVRNHGGGHANHSLLWTSLKQGAAKAPTGELAKAIDMAFGSFSAFNDKFSAAAMSVFGSGWAWLSVDATGKVRVETTPNQDTPITAWRTPLLGIDVWEHAYYLKFQNRRVEYVTAFANVVDWDVVSARYRDRK